MQLPNGPISPVGHKMKKFYSALYIEIIFLAAVLVGTVLFSDLANAQTPANNAVCLKALNNHKVLKFKNLSSAELGQLANLTYGISNNDLALFLLTSGKAISENCSKSVTDQFVGKLDSEIGKLTNLGMCVTSCARSV